MMRAVDLFAGWGGFTLGAELVGVDVVWAGNHWPLAVEAHSLNHPTAQHVCQDLRQADWSALPDYELLLASPACQGHSQASQPKRRAYHDALRATAWSVVDCADVTEPQAIVVENVNDFARWRLYGVWCDALRALGYEIQELRLTASRFGVPQRRKRLFIVATRKTVNLETVAHENAPEAPFGPCVDWELGRWRPVAGASENVRERVRRGAQRHGRRFITQHVTAHPGIGLDEPIRTITTKDQFAMVDNDHYRPLTVRETARAMGFPDSYAWPESSTRKDQIRGLGNAVCPPVASRLVGELVASL